MSRVGRPPIDLPVAAMARDYYAGYNISQIARRYGVNRNTVK